MTDSIQAQVRRDLVKRELIGRRTYGTSLFAHNGRNALRDAYEEALDLAVYLKQALVEHGVDLDTPEPPPLPPEQKACRERTDDEAQHLSEDFYGDGAAAE